MNLELPAQVQEQLKERARSQGVSPEDLARNAIIRYVQQGRSDGPHLSGGGVVDDGLTGETAATTEPHRDWHDKRHGHEAEAPLKHHGDKVKGSAGKAVSRPGGRPQYENEGLSRQSGEDFGDPVQPRRSEATGEDF